MHMRAYEVRVSDWSAGVCSSDLRRDRACGVEDHAVDRELAPLTGVLIARAPVIGDIPVVGARHIDHRMMARAARDLEILLKNLAHRLERPGRRRTHRISDRIVGTGPADRKSTRLNSSH